MSDEHVKVVVFGWSDALLLLLIGLSAVRLGKMLYRRVSAPATASESSSSSWRSDMLIVLRRPMPQTAVHVDIVRLADRVRVDGTAMRDALHCFDVFLRLFDGNGADESDDDDEQAASASPFKRAVVAVRQRLDPLRSSPDLLPGAISTLFRDEAELFHSLRSSAVLRASVNQGVLAPPFILLRQRFASAAAPLNLLRFRNEPRSWSIDIFTDASTADPEPLRVEHRRVFECELFDTPESRAPSLRFTFVMQLSIALSGAALDEFGIECTTSELTFATQCSKALRERIEELIQIH
jgi:hypothetical protein